MQVSLFFFLLVSCALVAGFSRNWMLEDTLPWEDDSDSYRGFYSVMSRSRRSEKMKLCGGKVFKMVMVTCGGECTASENDIATKCCMSQCDMEEIKSLCCPSR